MTSNTGHAPLLPKALVEAVPRTDIGRLFRAMDWATTPLGPIQDWPPSLRIALSICLNSRLPMFVWWGAELINLYNDAYAPLLGKRHPAAFGKPAPQTWSDIWDIVGSQADQVMRTGQPTWNERVLLVMERNGYPEETYFTWSYSPIFDEEGAISGLFCACTEETARVVAERDRDRLFREAQDALGTLKAWFDQAPGFVALLRGPDFVFEMVNDAYYQLVGHRQIEGLPAFVALPDLRNQGFEELMQSVYQTGEAFVGRALRVQVQEKPESPLRERFVDVVCQPVRDKQGHIVGIFAQGHDVTEQVSAVNALKEADRRKDEFLATLAHELRNPLAPIRQAAAVASSPKASAERKTWALSVIDRQAAHMSVLLEDLLDVSRISQGKLELRLQSTTLQEIVEAAVETVHPIIASKGHHLELRLPSAPLRLRADPVRLAQVVSNLLSNAAKYTDPGGRLEVEVHGSDHRVTLRVRDNGIGLSAASREQIFEMFSQVAGAMHRSEGGLGIGLALSKGLVHLHHGTLAVSSAGLGLGSEFTVSLPWTRVNDTEAEGAASSAGSPGAARTILLADDNEDALESLAALLTMSGHVVLTASDGRQALEMARLHRPQLAILDIGMPALSGYEVAREIRASSWGMAMQLVALSGWGQAEDVEEAQRAGFSHHLTKPVDPQVLQTTIERCALSDEQGAGA